jgi:glycosyltransferase involved in cell wall biosynthesis
MESLKNSQTPAHRSIEILHSKAFQNLSEFETLTNSILKNENASTIGFWGISAGNIIHNLKGKNRKVVILEPDKQILKLYKTSFKKNDIEIIYAETLDQLIAENPEIVVVDEPTKNSNHIEYDRLEKVSLRNIASNKKAQNKKKTLKILVQARGNILQARGGDTVALERTCEELTNLGVHVTIDPYCQSEPKDYDLIHLYNFATPHAIEPLAIRAVEAGVPYVVTTLYEDRPCFYQKMSIYGRVLEEYFHGSLSHVNFETAEKIISSNIDSFPDKGELNNTFAAKHAASLLASGLSEKKLLERDYPDHKRIDITPFGSKGFPYVPKSLFEEKHGISNYILCVARLEWRKNQAMLMKAMEDSEIPIVLIEGNITYQPRYQEVVPYFKRKGRNLLLSKLSEEELSSAYSGALAHVLPSWYELPGLVSLEAARCGTPVVATRHGTLPDYLGECPFYCEPDNIDSIRSAIEQAISTARTSLRIKEQKKLADSFTWKQTAEKVLDSYLNILELDHSEILLANELYDGN